MAKKYLRGIAGVIGVSLLLCAGFSSSSFAVGSWTDGTFTFSERQQTEYSGPNCTPQNVRIGGLLSSKTTRICVYEHGGWRYGTYAEVSGPPYAQAYTNFLAVGVGRDKAMYKVTDMSMNSLIEIPNSIDVFYNYVFGPSVRNLMVIRDFPSRLELIVDNGEVAYRLKSNSIQPLLVEEDGSFVRTNAIGISPNGRWLVMEVRDFGLVAMDVWTGQLRLFSDRRFAYSSHGSFAQITFVVSDDGRHVAAFDYDINPVVYTISDSCTLTAYSIPGLRYKVQNYHSCPDDEGRLAAAMWEEFGGVDARSKVASSFSSDSDTLYFRETEVSNTVGVDSTYYVRELYAGNYVASKNLDYLALGDSYSSGEGDTAKSVDGNKYYREYTNASKTDSSPEEKCHISVRSYPYLLAANMQLGGVGYVDNTRWQTVACSGAEARNDYIYNEGYLGQGGRLKTMQQNIESYRNLAFQQYIPGRVQQFEFVARDQPKVLTLTAGGNDVGFGYILRKCVSSGTCDYAEGHAQTATLAHTILEEKDKLKDLYTKLHVLSPKTKIYVIGYPQFISGKNNCGLNVQLDDRERSFARQGVTYMNDVIEAAAKEAGVRYVDIEDSIGDHALCTEDDVYVSGINRGCIPWLAWTSGDDCQEAFHPNNLGHAAMASRILADIGDLQNYDYCGNGLTLCPAGSLIYVQAPPLFKEALDREAAANRVVPEYEYATLSSVDYARKNPTAQFEVKAASLEPGSNVGISLASDPTNLGTYQVDDKGELNAIVIIPSDISAGLHTLYVDAKTFSGEPLRLWQIVTVYGKDGDLDEDGVADKNDPCLFVVSSGQDIDGDGIDDACDTVIGPRTFGVTGSSKASLLAFIASDNVLSQGSRKAEVNDGGNVVQSNPYASSEKRYKGTTQPSQINVPNLKRSYTLLLGTAVIIITGLAVLYIKKRKRK